MKAAMTAALALLMLSVLAAPVQAGDMQGQYQVGPGKTFPPYAMQQPKGPALPPKLSCRVGFDGGAGALQIRNDSPFAVPVGSKIQWLTSSGRSGVLRLRARLDPGWQEYEPALFPGTMADYNSTCTAAVVAPAPGFQNPPFGQQPLPTPLPAPVELPHLTCQLVADGGQWAALDLLNDGSVAIAAGSRIQWRTSVGRAGTLQLSSRLQPGWAQRVTSVFLRTAADARSSCTAGVTAPTNTYPGNPYPGQVPLPDGPARFEPPVSPHGHRLHACQSVNGDFCGGPIAQRYCEQRGYTRTNGYHTSRRAVVAETLDGEVCATSKCRVFTYIACVP